MEQEEEFEDDEPEDVIEKDYSNVPITVEFTATVTDCTNEEYNGLEDVEFCKEHPFDLDYDYKAYPGISCGGVGGGGSRFKTKEEAINHANKYAEEEKERYKIQMYNNRPVKLIYVLDGVKVDLHSNKLNRWF